MLEGEVDWAIGGGTMRFFYHYAESVCSNIRGSLGYNKKLAIKDLVSLKTVRHCLRSR